MPPGNRLEALRGERKGQHSIRVNDQYRICFVCPKRVPKTQKSWTITERATMANNE